MADGVKIVIYGDDNQYEKTLKNLKNKQKKAVETAIKENDRANELAQKAIDATDEKIKKSAEKAARAARSAADEAISEAQRASKEVAAKTQSVTNDSAAVVGGLNKVVKSLALGVGAVGATVIGMGVNYNAQIEQYTAGFTTMLGSAEKANETLSNLRGFAEKTPFELTDLANASTTLLAFGEDVDSLMPDLKMLGDISLGNSEKFKSLALVFGQVQSQGKLMGQDLLQMINSGFNPLQVISEKTGESMSSLKDKMSKGQISFEMVAEAMRMATSEGGQFYNAMEAQSKTFQGQMSTLKDNVTSLTGDIASDISEKLTDDVLPMLIEKVEQLKQAWADGSLQSAIGTATSGMVAFGVAVGGLNLVMIANDIIQLKKGVEGYTTATKLGAAAQKMMNAELLMNPYVLAVTAVAALTAGIITYAATHKSAAEEITDSLEDINESYQNSIDTIDKNMKAEIAQAETAKTLKDRLFELEEQINSGKLTEEEATAAQEDFNVTANKLNEIIPGIIDNIYDENGAMALQKGAVGELTQAYYDLMVAKAMANAYQEKLNTATSSLIDAKKVKEEAEVEFNNAKANRRGNGSILGEFLGERNVEKTADALDKANEEVRKYENQITEFVSEMASQEKKVKELMDGSLKNLKKNTNEGNGIVDNSNAARTASTQKAANDQEKILKEQREKELRDLQFAHDIKLLSDKDYYDALEKYRDKYFDEGSEEWQKYTQEIYNYNESVIKEAETHLEELQKKQADIAERLSGENKTFTKFKIVEGEKTKEYTMLADSGNEIQQLSRYKVLLDKLKERRSDLPEEVTDYLSQMGVEEGISYVEAMLNASDEEFSKYIEGLEEKQRLAKEISEKITLDETEELRKALEEEFGEEVPEGFFDLGDESARKFGEGFMNQLKGILREVRAQILDSMSSLAPSIQASISGAGGGTSNYYSNTYTFNSSKDTTTQQLFTARNAAQVDKLRGVT